MNGMSSQHRPRTGYSTFNFALTDGSSVRRRQTASCTVRAYSSYTSCGEQVVVARYCDKAPDIPPPSLYYAFASSHQLQLQLSQALTSSRDDAQEHTFRNQARLSRSRTGSSLRGTAPPGLLSSSYSRLASRRRMRLL